MQVDVDGSMPESFLALIQSLLVSIGAGFGACLRFKCVNTFLKYSINSSLAILFLNLISTFALGFLFGIRSGLVENQFLSSIFLLIGVGFLGSLSTFSTFIFQLLQALLEKDFKDFFFLLLASLFGGILLAAGGYKLGYG